jgi:hypothetical protein
VDRDHAARRNADALDDHDDVANVYADFDVSEEDMAKLG